MLVNSRPAQPSRPDMVLKGGAKRPFIARSIFLADEKNL
jgi:hypothetical protein